MKLLVTKAQTSKQVSVFIQDSSSTTGAGLTGLLFNSASLTWYYYREGQGTGATQVTMAAVYLAVALWPSSTARSAATHLSYSAAESTIVDQVPSPTASSVATRPLASEAALSTSRTAP